MHVRGYNKRRTRRPLIPDNQAYHPPCENDSSSFRKISWRNCIARKPIKGGAPIPMQRPSSQMGDNPIQEPALDQTAEQFHILDGSSGDSRR